MVRNAAPERNVILEARMRAMHLTAVELAEELNKQLLALSGRRGDLTDRTIRRFLAGQTRWPQGRQRLALEAVFGCTAEELGFVPRSGTVPSQGEHRPEEQPVHRRSFIAAAAAITAPGLAVAPARIGISDVARLRAGLDALSASDDVDGGSANAETDALTQAQRALDLLQRGTLSSRVRQQIYAAAAEATNHAAFAAIDSRQFERAQRHLDRALTLAGLSGDPVVSLATWDNIAMLSGHRGRFADAEAASRKARMSSISRRDPLYASLCHARNAVAHASMGELSASQRALGHAEDALTRAPDAERPRWMHFFDIAELNGLSAIAYLRLGRPDKAEFHAHYTLARLKPDLLRNRAYYTAQLAIAQLRQGELELACATADKLLTRELPSSARVRDLLKTFRSEASATGSARARAWLNNTTTVRI